MKITAAGAPPIALKPRTRSVEAAPDGVGPSVEASLPRRPQLNPASLWHHPQLAQAQQNLAMQAAGVARIDVLRDTEPAVTFVHRFNSELQLDPETLKKRNEITVSSPAKFFRVNPALFYDDVLGVYNSLSLLIPDRKAPEIIIAGDCHLGNFGTLRARDGSTFWGINDFDMAGKGTAEDDLERMATSLLLMSPLPDEECRPLVERMAVGYLDELRRLEESKAPVHNGITRHEARGAVAALIDKKSKNTQAELLDEFCKHGRLKRNHELKDPSRREEQLIRDFLPHWEKEAEETPELVRPLEVLDIARKTDSGGSTFGLNRYFILVKGKDGEDRILELKQELPTAPEQGTGNTEEANADYIFSCMKALGGNFEPTMAAGTIDNKAYYMRERQREKGALPISDFTRPEQWEELVDHAAIALARAHAFQAGAAAKILRWVDQDQDLLVERLQTYAETYARQTEQDCADYRASLAS
ncbi:MAG: DUF2252 family protein [Candidatus Eremiobacteraeota bacterium]|nr:DUF2252 family protein [Candidatus Eremiobacteraeota bacterium]